MKTFAAALLMAAGALAGAAGGGCATDPSEGYAFGTTYRKDIQTIAVPVFANQTFSRGVELRLTEAIATEIRRTTDWRITDAAGAQTTLTGSVVESRLTKLSTARETGLVEDVGVTLVINFEWRDARTGKVLAARRNFAASESFVPARGAGERLEIGQYGAIDRLAKDVVAELRGSW